MLDDDCADCMVMRGAERGGERNWQQSMSKSVLVARVNNCLCFNPTSTAYAESLSGCAWHLIGPRLTTNLLKAAQR